MGAVQSGKKDKRTNDKRTFYFIPHFFCGMKITCCPYGGRACFRSAMQKKNKFSFVLRSLNRIFAVVKAKITIMAVYDSLRSVQESFPYDKDNTAASETQWYLEQMVSCSQKDFQEGNVYTQDEVREMLLNRKLWASLIHT